MTKRILRAASVALALLVACGSDPLPTIHVQFSPQTVRATFRGGKQAVNVPEVAVDATLSPMPSENVYVSIVEDQPILYWNPVSYMWETPTGFTAGLLFDPALPGGTYTGQMTVLLCEDANCGSRYPMSGNQLYYELTVADPMTITTFVDGASVDTRSTVAVSSGAVVRIEVSEAVWFSQASGGVSAVNRTTTSTTWEAQLFGSAGSIGLFSVDVVSVAAPQGIFVVRLAVSG